MRETTLMKIVAAAIGVIAVTALRASAVTVAVDGSGFPTVCFALTDNNGQVSGIQMDIGWTNGCISANPGGNSGEAACDVNPQTNRTTFKTRVSPGGNSMRVIMLNIADTTPIPANVSQLFCCSFSAGSTGGTCPISLSNTIASDPKGTRLPVSTINGAVTVSGSGQSGNSGGVGSGPAIAPPPAVVGGAPAAPVGGGGTGGTGTSGTTSNPSGGGTTTRAGSAGSVPGAPGAPAVPAVPGAQAPAEVPAPAGVIPAAEQTVNAELKKFTPGTPKPTPAKDTPTAKAKATAKETPQPKGTPTPEKKQSPKKTPTATE